MRYIKTIVLENFQSYKKQIINLMPGLNLVLGSSDSGKSAILRAISFVLYNYPRNSTIIHNGATECKVTLEFSDGTKVARIKGTRNAYIAIDKNGKKYSLDKIDKSIPEEIKDLLNHPPEDDFNGFISYADQFSKMFLVDLSPSDLPRSLSSLTGIEMLEESAKQLMQNYKAIEKQSKSDEKDYGKLIDEYDQYNFVDEYDLKILSLKNQYEQLAALQESYDKMKEFDLGNLELVNLDCVQVLNKIISLCDSKLDKLSKTKQLIEEYDKLSIFNLLNSNINVSELSQLEVIIENSEVCIKKINDVKALINSCNDLEKIYKDYSNVKQEGELLTESYKKNQMQSENLDKELSAFKKMLIDKGIQCETCGSILK
jgi:exonuclease SbcC